MNHMPANVCRLMLLTQWHNLRTHFVFHSGWENINSTDRALYLKGLMNSKGIVTRDQLLGNQCPDHKRTFSHSPVSCHLYTPRHAYTALSGN